MPPRRHARNQSYQHKNDKLKIFNTFLISCKLVIQISHLIKLNSKKCNCFVFCLIPWYTDLKLEKLRILKWIMWNAAYLYFTRSLWKNDETYTARENHHVISFFFQNFQGSHLYYLAFLNEFQFKSIFVNIIFSQAISTKSGYDSEFSKELVLTCPGANSPEIYRVKTAVANCIKICWKKPALKGNAKVKNYWVSFITFQVSISVE